MTSTNFGRCHRCGELRANLLTKDGKPYVCRPCAFHGLFPRMAHQIQPLETDPFKTATYGRWTRSAGGCP